jgi:hypothetical protein
MVLYHQLLSNFPSFQHQIERFYVIGSAKQKGTNVFWTSKAKEQNRKRKKRKSDILSQILSLDPFYFRQLYLVHFSFILNNFKGYKCVISKSIKFV